jgi:twitching motility protein PilT
MAKREELEVDKFFRALVKLEGSDLHMKVGAPADDPRAGELRPLNRPPIERRRDGESAVRR